ncbi:hypothetical protein FIBSPDRAFT_970073 [Athelia psychrophila]|uniref:Uncharacterized protein n=1 Tax=Athelia psychrophila TaxID=1759441 RepID=A0A167SYQ3_9AGAM|nr:hypothetical protein FIBSPDRAFT_970073 [Fibularhizoctonia sp. CBS 109695]
MSFPTPIVIQAREEGEEGRMWVIVVDDEENTHAVSVGADAEREGDTTDLFASENADDEDNLLGHDLENEDNTMSSSPVVLVLAACFIY